MKRITPKDNKRETGRLITKGLRLLVERFCSRKRSNKKINNDGASVLVPCSMVAGVTNIVKVTAKAIGLAF